VGVFIIPFLIALLSTPILLIIGIVFYFTKNKNAKKLLWSAVIALLIAIPNLILSTSQGFWVSTFFLVILSALIYWLISIWREKQPVVVQRYFKRFYQFIKKGGIALAFLLCIIVSSLFGVMVGLNRNIEKDASIEYKELTEEIESAETKLVSINEELSSHEKTKSAKERYDDLQKKINETESKLESLSKKVKTSEETNTSEKDELETVKKEREIESSKISALQDDKDELTKEVDTLSIKLKETKKELDSINSDLDTNKKELNQVNETIKSKKSTLEDIENVITQKKEEPITLIAGQYFVGKDVPEGRYQVTNVDDGSNFFVMDSDGSTTVNTILGDGIGDGDYVFYTFDGDLIETRAKVKLIPIE
jgi:peptidoglycan hydrolase CwlO-like protein